MVDEVNYGISQVDPKKTVQVGSFRVDGNGNQNTYKVSSKIQEGIKKTVFLLKFLKKKMVGKQNLLIRNNLNLQIMRLDPKSIPKKTQKCRSH